MAEYQHLLAALVTVSSIELKKLSNVLDSDSSSQADGQKLPLKRRSFLIL
jgi:hypothetical protein